MHAFMEDDEDRNATQSARLRRICSGTDDDQPEDLILQYLNQSHPVAGRGRTLREPSGGIALSARTDDRMDTQSARMRRMCTGTDDDEPEAVLLELLNAQSCQKGHAVGPPRSRGAPGAPEDLDSMAYVTVSDDWDSESNKMEEQDGRSVRPGSLYSSPVGHRSMLSMQARAEPSPTLLKTSSLYNVQTTPTRGFRKFSDTPEPCSPGLLPSAKKQSYSFGDEAAEEWGDPDDPGPETNREFAYVDSLFSKIRHNRTGYVAAELEKGCDPAMKDTHGNTMLHICAQNNLKKMAKICLHCNCDINALDVDGMTPLDICDKLQFKSMADWLIFMGGENGSLVTGI